MDRERSHGPSGAAVSDEDLLRRMSQRETHAFGVFYDRHAGRIMRLLLGILGGRADAEEVLQETFWQAWSRASNYDSVRGSALNWLALIARSRAVDLLRRERRRRPAAGGLNGLSEDDAEQGGGESLARDLQERESAQRARGALASLPEEQRGAIELAFYGGLSHSEIAEQEGLPLGTVKTRIRRGMQRLREILDAAPEDSQP